MAMDEETFWIPQYVRDYLTELGFRLALDDMEGFIRTWDAWMGARGDFYDYRENDGFGRTYEVHRRSIMPAMRVCREWGSLLLNDKTSVVCDNQECTDWLGAFISDTNFMPQAQATVVKAFGLGTGAWAVSVDVDESKVRVRQYDARMVIPLTWDSEGVVECAFCTRAFYRGKAIDQLQMHVRGGLEEDGFIPKRTKGDRTYHIVSVTFDDKGQVMEPEGVLRDYDTGSTFPTFALVKPAIANTRVDMSPYGQSIFADSIDAIQAVDVAFDALINEVDVSKMRIFLSDVLFETARDGKRNVSIPFGKSDCTVFRKVMSTEDTIQEFAPALRTDAQASAFRIALQILGDACGLGLTYFDFDSTGYVKTATEVSSDNSALMRNIRRHENVLQASLCDLWRAVMACERALGHRLPDEGDMHVLFDDSIITDTAAEKQQDMAEVGVTMQPWEYRSKWYGEDEITAKKRVRGLKKGTSPSDKTAATE